MSEWADLKADINRLQARLFDVARERDETRAEVERLLRERDEHREAHREAANLCAKLLVEVERLRGKIGGAGDTRELR